MRRAVLLLALAACGGVISVPLTQQESDDISAQACGQIGCSSSLECNDILSSCRYCYQGRCSSTLPADPLDAGTDAPGGTRP